MLKILKKEIKGITSDRYAIQEAKYISEQELYDFVSVERSPQGEYEASAVIQLYKRRFRVEMLISDRGELISTNIVSHSYYHHTLILAFCFLLNDLELENFPFEYQSMSYRNMIEQERKEKEARQRAIENKLLGFSQQLLNESRQNIEAEILNKIGAQTQDL